MKYLFAAMTMALAITSFAQTPSLNLPDLPTQPLTVVFKNVTQHNLFQSALNALKKSKRVEHLVMVRAERGFIEYHGRYFGESDLLLQVLQSGTEGRLNFELKPKSDGGLEILITTLN
ncbi:MAG: hypothetical protein A3H42_02000 [Deltaproteobacteria bacterium RIFCSPLOWO2_02_FULL_46_8]|nr:MAG: hypothetical protein A3H42_02000 [Deltaproteobacteria bacterium RIFCSPLOWO2_02_FULL_46_8]